MEKLAFVRSTTRLVYQKLKRCLRFYPTEWVTAKSKMLINICSFKVFASLKNLLFSLWSVFSDFFPLFCTFFILLHPRLNIFESQYLNDTWHHDVFPPSIDIPSFYTLKDCKVMYHLKDCKNENICFFPFYITRSLYNYFHLLFSNSLLIAISPE